MDKKTEILTKELKQEKKWTKLKEIAIIVVLEFIVD